MLKQKIDLQFGLTNEIYKKKKKENIFGELKKTKNTYDNFDFYNNNFFIELKTRRINHNKYNSLYFDKCKYDKGLEYLKKGFRVIFIWDCIDKMVLWELKSDEKVSYFKYGGRTDRGKEEISKLCNIPTKHLINYSDFKL